VKNDLSVREAEESDLENIIDYFLKADRQFLHGMGVDPVKLPTKEKWLTLISSDHKQPIESKSLFYVIWLLDQVPIGHSNINKINFGEEAYMHLHMWRGDNRQKGIGLEFVKMSLPYYFNNFKLKNLYCEPYALNPAPNKTLKKLGFDLIKQYETIPGWIGFHQPVNKWRMTSQNINRFRADSRDR